MRQGGTFGRILVGASLLAAAACGGGTPSTGVALPAAETATGTDTVASLSENVDTTCAALAGYTTWKNGATGAACTSPLDCTPVCCPCPNGTHHTLAAWCNQGRCAAPGDVACMIDGTANLAGCSS